MRLTVYAAIVIAVFFALSLWSFWLTVRPPRLVVPGEPKDFRLRAEDVTIATEDGLRLSSWLIPRAGGPTGDPPPAIVLLHGYPASKADMLPIAAALHPHFATLVVDLRYFGASEGRATTLGFRERDDLKRAVAVLAKRGFRRVGVFGYSMGGAIALMAAAEDQRIGAVVAYAPFSDLRVLGREVYAGLAFLKYPLVELMIVWSRLFLGRDITRPSPLIAARTLGIPVLLIHSRDDDQIPFAHAESLRGALAGNSKAEFYFTAGGHNDRVDDFDRRVVEFFRKHLGH